MKSIFLNSKRDRNMKFRNYEDARFPRFFEKIEISRFLKRIRFNTFFIWIYNTK